MSVSQSKKIYWAKWFPSKAKGEIFGLKFSPDGVLLIAHSGWKEANNFIVVFNVATGKVLTARVYLTGGYNIYNSNVKSMLVSSGNIPMAYILSNIVMTNSLCNGQRLLKFDPLKFRSTPLWSYKTDYCENLGLTFGRNEVLLYAYSL